MSISDVCDAIAAIDKDTTDIKLAEIASKCETHLDGIVEVLDAVENTLASSIGGQKLRLWSFIDRLAKQHSIILDALRPKMISLATHYAPRPQDAEWGDFVALAKGSFEVLFGSPMISLVLMRLGDRKALDSNGGTITQPSTETAPGSERSQTALALHSTALRRNGAFITKAVSVARKGSQKHSLQVKTMDSQMAMNVASSYAPSRPVEILVPELQPDADAPRGYMKALPTDHVKNYNENRRKRLREIMQKNREEQDLRQREELLKKARQDSLCEADSAMEASLTGNTSISSRLPDFSDIHMPAELPRDEYGVKRGNFPLGVRFIRDAIAACGGAVELDVLVNRLSTLASKEATAEFGDVRAFLTIHSPTFRLELEKGQWIVRLVDHSRPAGEGDGLVEMTWEAMTCPLCSKVVKGRNYAWHMNCRGCITAQIALGLQGDFQGRGPIAELAFLAKELISHRDSFDDGDVDALTEVLAHASNVRRFRLASPRQFAPILKAVRIVRDRWLDSKGVSEVDDVTIDGTDASVVHLFRILGENIHRLPIAWIETGDVIDMCHRFTDHVEPPFDPPPRPADPRISLYNTYPGFLLCESEVDDEDDPSADEDEFSDDEAPAFTFAAPVELAESLFTAGFERDTKRLQHRMRTAPPMALQRVLKGDRSQTQREMYADLTRDQPSQPSLSGKVRSV
ncbi:unnamed protein product [Phytomonas sp. EM1]|nr:unnamed protein product [Phytomonas sp. EM1]|eukprot:CCW63457.1 unnamed protein product [Phytomonas sp. isolate EM1]